MELFGGEHKQAGEPRQGGESEVNESVHKRLDHDERVGAPRQDGRKAPLATVRNAKITREGVGSKNVNK